MIQSKICMLGSFSVGKTSLVKRYVTSLFDEKYLTTIGVKIDKKAVSIMDQEMMLMLWDIAGDDEFNRIKPSQLRGMAGGILVVDGTRSSSIPVVLSLYNMVREQFGDVPLIVALNKADLKDDQWVLDDDNLLLLKEMNCDLIETSAKEGAGVEDLFETLAKKILITQQDGVS